MLPQDAGLPDPGGRLPMPARAPLPVVGRIEPVADVRPTLPPEPPPALAATPDLMSMLQALRRRWVSAVLLGGTLSVITAVAVWSLLTPKATAFAKIRVSYEHPVVLDPKLQGSGDFKAQMQTAAAEITSRNVIVAALKRDKVRRLNLESRETDPALMIEEDLKVESKDLSELLTIQFSHADPVVALAVASAVEEAYLDEFVGVRKILRAQKLTDLEKAYDGQLELLTRKKERLRKMAEKLGTTDPISYATQRLEATTALRDARQQQVQLGFKLVEARSALEAFDARIKAASAERGRETPELAASVEAALDADPDARELRSRLTKLEELHEDYVQKGGYNYPTAVACRNRMKTVKDQLEKRRAAVVEKVKRAPLKGLEKGEDPTIMRAQLQRTETQLSDMAKNLAKQIEGLMAEANRPQSLGLDYETLQEEIRRDEKLVSELNEKVGREKLEANAVARITHFQDAELMKKDIKKQLLATLVAPVAVLFGVCGSLAWLDFRQRRIRSASEVSNGLGIRVVGAVPELPGLERRLVGPTGECDLEGHPVLESIDAIRTQLLHEGNARACRVVMVTSAASGEGKTTLASHLAGSLARAGRKTLLIDGDLRRPAVQELFEIPLHPGFSEVLLGEVELGDAVQQTPLENLSVMPAGQWDREVLLALSRDGLAGAFEKLVEEYDFLVIDSHPVLAATDALLIGRQADAVILSVLREVSQMPRVYAAAQKLQSVGIRVLGAVVNATDPEEMFAAPARTARAG